MTDRTDLSPRALLSAKAVRTRAHGLLEAGLAGELRHFTVDLGRLDEVAGRVIEVTRAAYPDLDIPFHSRWRHFSAGAVDRWGRLAEAGAERWPDTAARARAAFDLAILSVLLDAGAGSAWAYREAETGRHFGRSEGLGVASLRMFEAGAFSAESGDPLRADAVTLASLTADRLAQGFQVSVANPLVGVEGRAELLRRLGETAAAKPGVFAAADSPRPGGLFDHLAAGAAGRRIAAESILTAVLEHLGPVWPSRTVVEGVALGDTWPHPAATAGEGPAGLAPLHKLSQWLAYSLIEPLEAAGFEVVGLDGLTGLAEYRNGGLFVDGGVLVLRDPDATRTPQSVDSELVVEWRALTVALLDRLAERVRARLGLGADALPLPRVLEGGTWAAGRVMARERREDASPPIVVLSDGTVF